MSGFSELGLDPRCLVSVHAADVDHALRTAADALACDAVGAVVLEVWGEARQLDLVASRKLTLAAQASGATGLVLRMAAEPRPSTAETRWIVRAAHSPPGSHPSSAWGSPLFEAQLVRNRHGPTGRWIMEWKCDECLFGEPAAYPQPVAAAPAHRSHQAQLVKTLSNEAVIASREESASSPVNPVDGPSIVVIRQDNMLRISALDDAAAHFGLAVGLPLANARAICPHVQVHDADEAADAAALNAIAVLVRSFHPAGGARSAARSFSRHHGLRPSVRRRSGDDEPGVRRPDRAGVCRSAPRSLVRPSAPGR